MPNAPWARDEYAIEAGLSPADLAALESLPVEAPSAEFLERCRKAALAAVGQRRREETAEAIGKTLDKILPSAEIRDLLTREVPGISDFHIWRVPSHLIPEDGYQPVFEDEEPVSRFDRMQGRLSSPAQVLLVKLDPGAQVSFPNSDTYGDLDPIVDAADTVLTQRVSLFASIAAPRIVHASSEIALFQHLLKLQERTVGSKYQQEQTSRAVPDHALSPDAPSIAWAYDVASDLFTNFRLWQIDCEITFWGVFNQSGTVAIPHVEVCFPNQSAAESNMASIQKYLTDSGSPYTVLCKYVLESHVHHTLGRTTSSRVIAAYNESRKPRRVTCAVVSAKK